MKRVLAMKRIVSLAVVALVLSASAAWSFYVRTSVGTEMTATAQKFLQGLDDAQRSKAQLDYDSPKRVEWHFIPKESREGLQIKDMNDAQRAAAHNLLRAALSEVGYDKATKIMELEKLLAELQKGRQGPLRDYQRYYFTIFGKPTDDGRWGLSVEGHHLSLNFVVDKNQVVSSTPTALCTNPAKVMSEVLPEIKKGTEILPQEEQLAFDLLKSLSDQQRKTAVIAEKAPSEVRAAGEAQPPTDAPAGIAAANLQPEQVALLKKLIAVYAGNVPKEVAAARIGAIEKAGFDKVHFCWAGADKRGIGHYYRVQGPTFVIEFINVQPDAAGNPANHIHSLWRDMQGDFALPIKG
jgi:hypothetical protein